MRAKKQPPALQLKTVAQVRAWVKQNVRPYDAASGDDLPEWTGTAISKATLWWYACSEAQGYSELRTKEIASILLAGLQALKLSHLQETLDSAHENEDESEPAAQQLETSLREHFGSVLKRP